MGSFLTSVGTYVSGVGGSGGPARVPAGEILFELITEGAVYDPSGEHLRDAGWVFCHQGGEDTIHRSEEEGHYECFTARFDASLVQAEEHWPRSFFWGDAVGAVTFCHEMLTAYHQTEVPDGIIADLIWSQFRFRLDLFLRQEVRREIPTRISNVMAYIDGYYAQDLGIEELAAQATLSPSHLHARFKEFVGCTPHQYLVEQRMREARHRLVTTSDPIKAIAPGIGYANTENFCRAFKARFKVTAAAYRNKHSVVGLRPRVLEPVNLCKV